MAEEIHYHQIVTPQKIHDSLADQTPYEGSSVSGFEQKEEKIKLSQNASQDHGFLNIRFSSQNSKKIVPSTNLNRDNKPFENSEKRKNPQSYNQQMQFQFQNERQLEKDQKNKTNQNQVSHPGQLFYNKQAMTEKEKQQIRKQMEDDMADLKNSILNKKKHMIPQNHKKTKFADMARLNRTVNQIPKSKHFTESVNAAQSKIDELRIILKMAQSKMSQNYKNLKQWDKKREQILALHLSMINRLNKQVDKRIKASLQNFQTYEIFFKQRAKQQEKYCNYPVIDTRKALQNNNLSKFVFINCSIILNSFSDQNTQKCKRIAAFANLIKQNILKDLMDSHIQFSQQQLLRVRQKISKLKEALEKGNQDLEEISKQLNLLFKKQSENIHLYSEEDFLPVQLNFLRKVDKQMEIQKKLGQYSFEYYQLAIQQELKRTKTLKQAILMYNEGLYEAYRTQIEKQELELLKKSQQPKLINEYYSFEQLFQERYAKMFKEKQNIQDKQITVAHFSKFIMNFSYQLFDFRNLFLKQFKAQCSIKGHTSKYQPCLLVISINDKNRTHPYSQPDGTVRIAQKSVQLKPLQGVSLEICKKNERRGSMMSYLWQNKHEMIYHIKFLKADSKQQFFDYVRKLMK